MQEKPGSSDDQRVAPLLDVFRDKDAPSTRACYRISGQFPLNVGGAEGDSGTSLQHGVVRVRVRVCVSKNTHEKHPESQEKIILTPKDTFSRSERDVTLLQRGEENHKVILIANVCDPLYQKVKGMRRTECCDLCRSCSSTPTPEWMDVIKSARSSVFSPYLPALLRTCFTRSVNPCAWATFQFHLRRQGGAAFKGTLEECKASHVSTFCSCIFTQPATRPPPSPLICSSSLSPSVIPDSEKSDVFFAFPAPQRDRDRKQRCREAVGAAVWTQRSGSNIPDATRRLPAAFWSLSPSSTRCSLIQDSTSTVSPRSRNVLVVRSRFYWLSRRFSGGEGGFVAYSTSVDVRI
ncbi:hypothetical protein Q8A73_001074 [Channa argus]|nr:hypothetical protein Q8A73_001074 [Channa argus]